MEVVVGCFGKTENKKNYNNSIVVAKSQRHSTSRKPK
jgi:hypothetical protein